MADPTAGQIGWAELSVTHGHTGDVSFAEFELPWGHTGDLSWAELQTANVATEGRLSWGELQTANIATAGLVSWGELITPLVATAGRVSFATQIVPFIPTAGQVGWGDFEFHRLPTAGRVSVAHLQTPFAAAAAVLSTVWFRLPKSYAASFALSNGTVDIYRSANLEAIQSAGQITHVDITSPGAYYTEANDIIVTAVHASNNTPGNAVLEAEIGAQTTKAGTYRTTKGFLSADKFLQDPDYYNEHTYVIRVAESSDRWNRIYKKVLHPAGFKLIGEFVATISPSQFTLTPEDAIVVTTGGGFRIGGAAVIVTSP
jgi:hypothetical protein